MHQVSDTRSLRKAFVAEFMPRHEIDTEELGMEDILDARDEMLGNIKDLYGSHFNRDAAAAESFDWLSDRGYTVS